MHAKILSPFLILLLSVVAVAQRQIVQFKQLQQFLPQGNFETYVQQRPTGETSSMMGFATSWAQENYNYSSDSVSSTLSVKITDMLNLPSYMSVTSDVDRKTQTGYERTVIRRALKILEMYDSTAKVAKLQFPIANRFLVEISGANVTGTKLLYGLLDRTDIAGLEKFVQPIGDTRDESPN